MLDTAKNVFDRNGIHSHYERCGHIEGLFDKKNAVMLHIETSSMHDNAAVLTYPERLNLTFRTKTSSSMPLLDVVYTVGQARCQNIDLQTIESMSEMYVRHLQAVEKVCTELSEEILELNKTIEHTGKHVPKDGLSEQRVLHLNARMNELFKIYAM